MYLVYIDKFTSPFSYDESLSLFFSNKWETMYYPSWSTPHPDPPLEEDITFEIILENVDVCVFQELGNFTMDDAVDEIMLSNK